LENQENFQQAFPAASASVSKDKSSQVAGKFCRRQCHRTITDISSRAQPEINSFLKRVKELNLQLINLKWAGVTG